MDLKVYVNEKLTTRTIMINNSLEDIAFRTAVYFTGNMKTKDSFGRALLGSNEEYFKKTCFIYLYQTEYKGFLKFGISNNPEKRAKTSTKNRDLYAVLLFSLKCDDRMTALAVEQALIQKIENLAVTKPHQINNFIIKKEFEEKHLLFEELKKIRGSSFGTTEITMMPMEKIQELILEFIDSWNDSTPREFFNLHAQIKMKNINQTVENLLNQKEIILKIGSKDPTLHLWGSTINIDEKYEIIPLENVPLEYKKIYGKEMI